MSAETREWLNTMTLQSRAVWHTDANIQRLLDQPTVYDGPIPAADIKSRLFHWEPLELDITAHGTVITPDGVESIEVPAVANKAVCRPPRTFGPDDPGEVFWTPRLSYRPHSYATVLVDNIADLFDDSSLGFFSAGLLRGGALAWTQISVPDTFEVEGVVFQPNLVSATSLDTSLSTTHLRSFKNAVCDNTLSACLADLSTSYKIRHSSGSDIKIAEARTALHLQFEESVDAFSAAVASLNATTVTDAAFDRFLESLKPTTDEDGLKTGAAATIAKNYHAELRGLWREDPRVEPWKNTAWGVVQAVNTHAQHVASVRGDRDETNMRKTILGDFDSLDAKTMRTLEAVLA